MSFEIGKVLAFLIAIIVVVIVAMWALTRVGAGQTQYGGIIETASVSPKCTGWQSITICENACYTKNACDTTYCNPQDPSDSKSTPCNKFLENMKNHAVVDVSPKEVKLDSGKTVSIAIIVTDQDKNPIKAKATASGAGTGKTDDTTKGQMSVTLKSVGAINIDVTPADSNIQGSEAVVSVVK
ncbi:Uncharacterised protein [uncultured archaeon]|nr:Uncharacterised protein [uncultured archaeon]